MQDRLGKPIVRYPNAVVVGVTMAYIIIVRTFEVAPVLALQFDGRKPSTEDITWTDHRDFLLVSLHEAINADRLRIWFELETEAVRIPFKQNQYRQYHARDTKNFIDGRIDASAEQKNRRDYASFIMHNQSQHTEQTGHNTYGSQSCICTN